VAVDFPVISMTLNAYMSILAARCCATREVESLTDRLRGVSKRQGQFDAEQEQGGVTPIDSIVTAATALVNLYTKEGVESLLILPYTSENLHVVNGQQLKFNTVNSQSPKISVVNGQNAKKSWSKKRLLYCREGY